MDNYNNPGQFLDLAHGANVLGHTAPDPMGRQHDVVPVGKDGRPMRFADQPKLSPFDVVQPVQAAERQAATLAANALQTLDRHGIDTVIRSLQKEREDDAAALCKAIH